MHTQYPSSTRRQRLTSFIVWLLGVAALVCAVGWWSPIERLFQSRLAVTLVGVWCICFGAFLLPDFRAGFAEGIREFRSHFDDHDDDDPKAA